ncbi:serine/threonine-protein kinase RsbW [Ferrimonas sediminum]|uniref:Serine/threonine-protein kinase RsbW n=1 Tax=Ferrimonas sediminum TaxID=718193 RepID=A0A1G8T3L4_9GAMM|nr:ATP-binding protein [Ferrimonas sediminum]SDJ36053.1 serine/threonine-protein kinase RsbW [Ferrimonas sediminum]
MECCITLKGMASYDVVAMMAKSVAAMYELSALPQEDAGLVELAVAEIGNNVVEHAYGNRPGGSLEVHYRQQADGIEIVLVDEGIAMAELQRRWVIEPQLLAPDPDDPSTWLTSGRGLVIVDQVMDCQSYYRENERNYFRMTKQA